MAMPLPYYNIYIDDLLRREKRKRFIEKLFPKKSDK
jgi:hypothetical protein